MKWKSQNGRVWPNDHVWLEVYGAPTNEFNLDSEWRYPAVQHVYCDLVLEILTCHSQRSLQPPPTAAAEDQRIDIEGEKITRVQRATLSDAYPAGAKVLDPTGNTVTVYTT